MLWPAVVCPSLANTPASTQGANWSDRRGLVDQRARETHFEMPVVHVTAINRAGATGSTNHAYTCSSNNTLCVVRR
jgi:hypothetical protein